MRPRRTTKGMDSSERTRCDPRSAAFLQRAIGPQDLGDYSAAVSEIASRPFGVLTTCIDTFCPSASVRMPAFSTTEMWMKTSLPPLSGAMNP